jgi:tRNA(fMet)-specific endonuclease VapC
VSGYLLDTSTCVAFIRKRPIIVRQRLAQELSAGVTVAVPTVVLFELWYGIEKSAAERREANRARLGAFITGRVEILAFDAADGRCAALIRKTLNAAGTPIGAYDLLIAAQAAARGMTLVTSNLGEFRRVEQLVCEDWAAE